MYAQLVTLLRKYSAFDSAQRPSDERKERVSLKKRNAAAADDSAAEAQGDSAADQAFQAWSGDEGTADGPAQA